VARQLAQAPAEGTVGRRISGGVGPSHGELPTRSSLAVRDSAMSVTDSFTASEDRDGPGVGRPER